MTAFRVQAKRTNASGPPADLEFGELAYSDADQQLYIGRPAPAPPTVFPSNLTDYSAAIADLTTDLATLDTSQTAQGQAISLLSAASDSQGDAIGQLATTTSTLNGALVSLAANVQAALEAKANDADLATVSKTGAYSDLTGLPTLFSGAYGDLTGRPALFSGAYGDLSGKPALFSGAYGDLSGKPTLFSGAYADLSGKPALFSGAYGDLSGKPALFSGAYGDLSGRPTIPAGFTYDQQSEPVGPAAGATWRERSSGGLITGEWEWSGSVWVALTRTTVSDCTVNSSATAYPATLAFEAPRCLFVQCRIAVSQSVNPSTPFNSTNYRELFLARGGTGAGNAIFTFRPLISLAQAAYVSTMNYLNPSGSNFFTGTSVVGTPGTMNAPSVSWVYREVRA